MMQKSKKVVFTVIISFLIVIVSLIFGEIISKIAKHAFFPTFVFRQYDPDIGFGLIPNSQGQHKYCFDGYVSINSHGMRDRERSLQKPTSVYRIGVFSDSLTEAVQVKPDEIVTQVLETRLNQDLCTSNCEVLNFGVGSYSTLQEYLLFEQLGHKFDLDMVLLIMIPNDLFANIRPGDPTKAGSLKFAPYLERAGPTFRIHPPAEQPAIERIAAWAAQHSDLVLYAGRAYFRLIDPLLRAKQDLPADVESAQKLGYWELFDSASPTSRLVWDGLEYTLERFKEAVEQSGAKFAIAYFGAEDTFWWYDPLPEETELPSNFDPQMTRNQIERFARKLDVPVLNLGEKIADYIVSHQLGPPYLSFSCDTHFTPLGHEVMADSLFEFIAANGLVDQEARQGQ